MIEKTATWSEPKLCHYDYDMSKPWFVYFDFTDNILRETQRKQYRSGINYHKTKEKRLQQGNALKTYLKERLESGWNPLREAKKLPNAAEAPRTIREAMDRIVKGKKSSVKKTSYENYRDNARLFLSWAKERGYDQLPLFMFKKDIAQEYMDYVVIDLENSGRTHNSKLGLLVTICNGIVDRWEKEIPVNPFAKIKKLPTSVGKNIAYTKEEAIALMKYYKERDMQLYYASNFMFHCYIRRTELMQLKVGDIDWQEGTITINSESAKNREQDSVTIPTELMDIMHEMDLQSQPDHHYIFGHKLNTCEQRLSHRKVFTERHRAYVNEIKTVAKALNNGDKLPHKRLTATKFMVNYNEEFDHIANLHTDKTFYSWKHTGVVMYWKEIKDIYFMMRQLRHHDIETTMIYLKSLGQMPNEAFKSARVSIK